MAGANQLVSFRDLQDLIDNEGFTQNNPFTVSDKLADQAEVVSALVVESIPLFSQQLVQRSLIIDAGGPACRQVFMNSTGSSTLSLACDNDSFSTLSHNGNSAYPIVGNTVYLDGVCGSAVNGGGNFYKMDNEDVAQIGAGGIVSSVQGPCAPPQEVFYMGFVNFSSKANACASSESQYQEYSHDGDNLLPEYGDTVYDGLGGTIPAGFRKSDPNTANGRFIRQFDANGVYILGEYC